MGDPLWNSVITLVSVEINNFVDSSILELLNFMEPSFNLLFTGGFVSARLILYWKESPPAVPTKALAVFKYVPSSNQIVFTSKLFILRSKV